MPQLNQQPSTPEREDQAAYAFVTNVAEIRRRARHHIRDSTVAGDDGSDRDTVLRLLNEALAAELVCVWRYKWHYFTAADAVAEALRAELLAHANEEQRHADQLARRIVELGGAPNLNPDGISGRNRSEYAEGETLADMLAEDLIAERVTIESYREIIQYLGTRDSTTRGLFESILSVEEGHAEDIRNLREDMLRRNHGSKGHRDAGTVQELQ